MSASFVCTIIDRCRLDGGLWAPDGSGLMVAHGGRLCATAADAGPAALVFGDFRQ
jgi:hypothetical protein